MNITVCGSITFLDEMNALERDLKKLGFVNVFSPIGIGGNEKEFKDRITAVEDGERKIEHDLIHKHFHKILKSDCILVVNLQKKDIPGYIGGNTFLEMGFAFISGKPIFLLNPIPEMDYTAEIKGMQPIIIYNKLSEIKNYYNLTKKPTTSRLRSNLI